MVRVKKTVQGTGIIAGFAAALLAVAAGVLDRKPAALIWGAVFFVSALVTTISSTRVLTPRDSLSRYSVGTSEVDVPDWALLVIAAACLVGIVGTLMFPPWY